MSSAPPEGAMFACGQLVGWVHAATAPPKARVLLVHGLNEHSGRHWRTLERLAVAGYEVVRFDLRGAGRSQGRRQWVDRFEDYVDDLASVHRHIEESFAPLPCFLLGHSLGGAVSAFYLVEHQAEFAGFIASAPAYQAGGAATSWRNKAARVLDHIAPRLRVSGSLGASAISRDEAEVRAFETDPLCCRFVTVHQGREILDALPHMPDKFRQLRLPLLVVQGAADRLVNPAGSQELVSVSPSADKRLATFDGGYHELHNDLCREEYFDELVQWLDKRTAES